MLITAQLVVSKHVLLILIYGDKIRLILVNQFVKLALSTLELNFVLIFAQAAWTMMACFRMLVCVIPYAKRQVNIVMFKVPVVVKVVVWIAL